MTKGELFGEEFPWIHIKKVIFSKKDRTVLFEFNTGNKLKATPPDEEKWDEMIRGAMINLNNDQVIFK